MAQEVAKEVLIKVRNGKRPNMQEIQQKYGYSKQSARAMKAKRTETFKKITKPIVEEMEKERNRLLQALASKDLTLERYRDLIDGVDKLTKNMQLLTGGATENVAVLASYEEREQVNIALDAI